MSNNESFIDEVNEEVQRDRLFILMRKYGWIGILAVILLVGGTAYNEWRKAQDRAAAEALGDAFLAAVNEDEPDARIEALAAVEAEGDAAILRDLLRAAEMVAADDLAGASDLLNQVADTPGIDPVYGDLARLKAVMAGTGTPEARITLLADIARPGGPYRLLAMEQIALAEAEAGNTDAAIDMATAVLDDADISRSLGERMQNLIVALGGTLDTDNAAQIAEDESE